MKTIQEYGPEFSFGLIWSHPTVTKYIVFNFYNEQNATVLELCKYTYVVRWPSIIVGSE